jgi:cytochrome c556
MRTTTRLLGLCAVVGTAGLLTLPAADGRAAADEKAFAWHSILPAAEYKAAVERDAKIVLEAIAAAAKADADLKATKKNELKRVIKTQTERARAGAMMIALYAESNRGTKGTDEQQLATLRSTAITVAKELEEKNFEAAAKAAKELSPTIKADASAPKTVDLTKAIDPKVLLHDVMGQLKLARVGGKEYEKMIQDGADKGVKPADLPKFVNLGYETAFIAQFAEALTNEQEEGGKKKRSDWKKWSVDMREGSLKVAQAAAAKKVADVKAALGALNVSCKNCHDVYRDLAN